MIVLDTNVLSDLMRTAPTPAVLDWINAQPPEGLYTTTINQAEILFGLAILPHGAKERSLAAAADQMFAEDFCERILPFDSAAAVLFAKVAAERRHSGKPIAQLDAQIAAIALSRGAAVATRNTADFTGCGVEIVNPWS